MLESLDHDLNYEKELIKGKIRNLWLLVAEITSINLLIQREELFFTNWNDIIEMIFRLLLAPTIQGGGEILNNCYLKSKEASLLPC